MPTWFHILALIATKRLRTKPVQSDYLASYEGPSTISWFMRCCKWSAQSCHKHQSNEHLHSAVRVLPEHTKQAIFESAPTFSRNLRRELQNYCVD
eukprot:6211832-Amphidinium_carterae.1